MNNGRTMLTVFAIAYLVAGFFYEHSDPMYWLCSGACILYLGLGWHADAVGRK